MNDIATKEINKNQFEDGLQSMLISYEREMNIRLMAVKRSKLNVILTTTAEVAEKLVKIKFGDAAKALFEVSKYKLNVLEEEQKIKGREIAYVYSANKKFANNT